MRASACFRPWAIAGALWLFSAGAAAETAVKPYPTCARTPTEGDITAAKGAFDAGNASFKEADYDRAIEYWEDAYRRDCTAHPLLLDLARAYELTSQRHHAVSSLQTYLDRNQGSPDESQIRRRIEKLEDQIRADAATPTTPATTTPGPAPAPTPTEATPAPAAAPPEEPPKEQPAPSSGSRPIAPLIVAGAGGAVAIVSGIVFFHAKSDVSHFADECPDRKCPDNESNLKSDGNAAITRENVFGAFTLIGLGALGGGLVWYFVSKPEPAAGATASGFKAAVSPTVGYGYGGLDLAGRF